jgi:hypothetical protein
MTNNLNPRDEFQKLLEETERLGAEMIAFGSALRIQGAFAQDLARRTIDIVRNSGVVVDYSSATNATQKLHDHLLNFNNILKHVDIGQASAYFGGTAVASIVDLVPTNFEFSEQNVSDNPELAYLSPRSNWNDKDWLVKPTLYFDHCIKQLNRLGFANSQQGRSAIKQFEAAWSNFFQGLSTSTASLITLREAVNQIIAELIRRLPMQQEIGKHKILAISKQAGANFIVATDIGSLQEAWTILSNQLSGSKKGEYSRSEEQKIFRDVSLFLFRFLTSIDDTKLRQK